MGASPAGAASSRCGTPEGVEHPEGWDFAASSPDRLPSVTGCTLGSMPPIRRLPVLQSASTADDDRPAWHWVVIGFLFAFSIWAPLAMLASWGGGQIVRRILGDLPADELGLELAQASSVDRFWLWFGLTGAPIVAYTFSCWAAGALVGRFGGKAGPKEAAVAGGLAALAGAGLTLFRASAATSTASLLILVPLGVGGAWLGGRMGWRLRTASVRRSPPDPPQK